MTPARALIKRYAQDTVIPIDYGIPFNPLSSPEENLDAPVHKREVGYLGIFLVKNLVNQADYEYKKKQKHSDFVQKIIK